MADEPAGPQSRAPEVEDLIRLCRALNEAGARYLVIGGFAVLLHGYARMTHDVDLLVDPSPENVRLLKRALAILPDNAVAELADDDLLRHQVVRVADEIVVDLLASACGVDISQAMPTALRQTVEGVEIPYPDAATLLRTKQTWRSKDRQDADFLRQDRPPRGSEPRSPKAT